MPSTTRGGGSPLWDGTWCEEEEVVAAEVEDSAVCSTSSMGEGDSKERLGEVYAVAGELRRDDPGLLLSRHGME